MSTPRVVVTGYGTVSPLGQDVDSTWEGLVAGRNGVAPITLFDAADHETRFAAEVKGFDPARYLRNTKAVFERLESL